MPQITLLRRRDDGVIVEERTFRGPADRLVIGRSRRCEFHIRSQNLGGQHSFLTIDEEGIVTIDDMGSANGIHVNGARVARHVLTPGIPVQLADTFIELADESALSPRTSEDGIPDELVQAIRSAPHDDAASLVLGDWLVERGDPRGELIGISHALAGQPPDEQFIALTLRARELVPHATQAWRAMLGLYAGCELRLRRGVPSFIGPVSVEQLVRIGSRIHQLPLEGIRISFNTGGVELLTSIPRLPCARVELHQLDKEARALDEAEIRALTGWPALTELRCIELSMNSPHLATLIAAPSLAGLTELAIASNLDRDIAGLEVPHGLRALNLRLGGMPDRVWQELATRSLPQLDELRIGDAGGSLSPMALAALTRAPFVGQLRTFAASSYWFETPEARAIAATIPRFAPRRQRRPRHRSRRTAKARNARPLGERVHGRGHHRARSLPKPYLLAARASHRRSAGVARSRVLGVASPTHASSRREDRRPPRHRGSTWLLVSVLRAHWRILNRGTCCAQVQGMHVPTTSALDVEGLAPTPPFRMLVTSVGTRLAPPEHMRSRSIARIVTLVLVAVLLTSCAPGANPLAHTATNGSPAGFFLGLWHGAIIWVTFLVSLFDPSVAIYEVHNSGPAYNLGFVIGAACLHGGGGAAARRRRRSDT